MAGIYLHIPFCRQACHYCDFHFTTNLARKQDMARAIASELQLQQHFLQGETIRTIYFGGGTPSLLTARELQLLLDTIHQHFTVEKNAEITLEANPDDLDKGKLLEWKKSGINRLSIGIQSFNPAVLKFLNRVHSAGEALQAASSAREAGFNNLTIDLIYGIPGAPAGTWQADLEQAISLKVPHISAYCLTIEEKTVFGNWHKKGKLHPADDELAAQQFDLLVSRLEKEGYEQYEVSNFCLPGFHSRHNSSYWQQQNYLGVGPGAHSYNGVVRQFNVRHNPRYLAGIARGEVPCDRETLSTTDHINEYLLTRLRTIWGVDMAWLKSHRYFDLATTAEKQLEGYIARGLATKQGQVFRLNRKGLLLADLIAEELFLEENKTGRPPQQY